MTYLELAVAMAVLAIALSTVSRLLVSSASLAETNRESAIATEATRLVMEEIQAANFRNAFSLYNATDADDPVGGTVPGSSFDVLGLDPVPGDPDGRVGEIVMPWDPNTHAILREDLEIQGLGAARDLNADGAIDKGDHSADYEILPILVRLEWQGAAGPQLLENRMLLVDR